MSIKAGTNSYPLNWLRWLTVFMLAAAGVIGNSIYGDLALLYRVVALVALAAVALWIAVNTKQGASVWLILRESQTEVRKVVWPSRQETSQTALIVVILVIVMAVILWGLDSILGRLVSLVIG